MSEKTEQPTPKKLQDSRKKGQVAQSPDIPKLLICAALFEMVLAMSDFGMNSLQSMVLFPITRVSAPFEEAFNEVLSVTFEVFFILAILSVLPAVVGKLIGSWMQFGFLVAPEALKIEFSRLNPVSALKQMFAPPKLIELLTNFLKASLITLVIYFAIKSSIGLLLLIPTVDLDTFWRLYAGIFASIERTCLLILLVLSAADYGLKRHFHIKQLRMTKDEVKREFKDQEGDPQLKGQRKAVANEMANSPPPPPKPLKDADAVVVNPTHFAVALHYRAEETPLPQIIRCAQDEDAKGVIKEAMELGIPVIRYVWLARTLFKLEEGSFIPRETLKPVAEIYKIIRELEEEEDDDSEELVDREVIDFPESLI